MLATLLTFAAEAAEEDENLVPFYIIGGVAAAWAILLFAVGMRSATFPSSAGAQLATMAVSVLVVAGAMAAAVLTA